MTTSAECRVVKPSRGHTLFSVCQTYLHISSVSTGIIIIVAEKHFKNRSSEFLIYIYLNALLSHSLFVVEHLRQKLTCVKMVYPYLANTVPVLEVSTYSGWPVLITVLMIQASYMIDLAYGL